MLKAYQKMILRQSAKPELSMHITHLSLTNFRNYVHLELDLPPRVTVFLGDNAQGKTNLLESVFYLATTKSPRTSSDRELLNWLAQRDDLPFARVAGRVQKSKATAEVDITLMARQDEGGPENGANTALGKRIRVNGLAKRAMDLIGQVNVVMFSPQDIELVAGAPQLRRRYLDIMNSQVDFQYLRALQHYSRVLQQRNHLLRVIRDRHAQRDQLAFWDEQMIESGSYIIGRRRETIDQLNEFAQAIHPQLTGRQEHLKTSYVCTTDEGSAKSELLLVVMAQASDEDSDDLMVLREAPEPMIGNVPALPEIKKAFREKLDKVLDREVALGMSVVGPHRDDLQIAADGVDLNIYGSRGQQRTAALTMKLAEAALMQAETDESPILLLDDIMSELDAERRKHLLDSIGTNGQVMITSTDLDRYDKEFLSGATVFKVVAGQVEKVAV